MVDWSGVPSEVILGVPPSKSNSYIIAGKRLIKSKAIKDYEASFLAQVRRYKDANIEGPLDVKLNVYYPNRRSDLDGAFKVTMDLMQKANVFSNDNKVVHLEANKYLDKASPRIEFWVKRSDRADV